MKNGFRVMDSDMHVIEPADLWDRYIDPAFSERRPQGASRWPGDMQIEVEGRVMPDPPSGWGKSRADEQAGVYADGYANNFDSGSQLRAMDAEGIDVAILFPSRGLVRAGPGQHEPRAERGRGPGVQPVAVGLLQCGARADDRGGDGKSL